MKLVRKATIKEISPYQPGEGDIFDNEVIKLSANENPFGCSPLAKAAYIEAAGYLNRYPEGGSSDLRKAIAKKHEISLNQIICGNGSDEIFSLLMSAFTEAGDEIIYTEHGFLMYKFYALVNGVKPVVAREVNLKTDITNILNQVTDKTRIVFVANPNNPTGSYVTHDELVSLRESLRSDIILVIDGAYAEYVTESDYEDGFALVRQYENVVATRTFSKIYGLASLRIGYCFASDSIIDVLNRVRGPFNVNLAAQMAALAAIEDKAFCEQSRSHNDKWLAIFQEEFAKLNVTFIDSVANFFLIRSDEAKLDQYREFLSENKLKIRKVAAYGLPDYLRITIGADEENKKLLQLSKEFWL
ncbi:MAG: histidinol-phosphate transaminase [Rickettsiales bacterium]|jgi:histidinol-phosphate aminotransferase|nr:histidinol-phosphate transaminase [Rickettsiales bacterium]